MKKVMAIVAVLLVAVFMGCANQQLSSAEDARAVVKNLPDFQTLLQYFSIQSRTFEPTVLAQPRIYQSEPKLGADGDVSFVHVVIYRTSKGGCKLAFLDDSRPPRVVASKELQ